MYAEFRLKILPSRGDKGNYLLPDVDRADARGARTVSDDLRFENNFDVLPLPITRHLFQHFFHALLVHQKLAGSDSPASADACAYDHQLLNIGIDKARHDSVVRVGSG